MADTTTVPITAAVLREHAPPAAEGSSHKGMRGRVLIVAGAVETPGAALLAATAALRAGAGVLQVATAESVARHLAVAMPEARVVGLPETARGDVAGEAAGRIAELASAADAVLVGPGLSDDGALEELLTALLTVETEGTLVVDARALRAVRAEQLARCPGRVLLTPNLREAAEMLGQEVEAVTAEPVASLGALLDRFGCTVALRGAQSYIGAPGSDVFEEQEGTAGLGSSGSGDVAAGLIAGLAALGASALDAALWGVHVHAQAGQRLGARVGRVGYLARELLDELTPVMEELRG